MIIDMNTSQSGVRTINRIFLGCAVGLFGLLTALPVHAQEAATLVLRDGQRPSGQLLDLNAEGYLLVVNGQNQIFPANDVASIEYVVGPPPPEAQARIDAGQSLLVMRNGQIVDGRLTDISGTRPKILHADTPSGQREFMSSDVAQIYLYAPRRAAAVAPAQALASAPAGAIIVQGNQPWTSAGISVRKGDRIAFAGTGDIMIAANASSGVGGSPAATSPSSRYPVFNSPCGALIARVGNGAPFAIGPNVPQPVTMPANGQLFLGVNDDAFGDNSGTFAVTITRLLR